MTLYDENGEPIVNIGKEEDGILLSLPSEVRPNIVTSVEKLREIFRDASEDKVQEFYLTFNEFAREFRVDAEVNENFFLAQIVAETGYGLDGRRENLNYSESALKSTFSRYKNNPNWANRDGRNSDHAANQVNIGNVAYADRIGNGDIASGDGYRFRGGGYFQLTGRYNYQRMSDVIQQTTGDPIGAEGLEHGITEPQTGVLSALAFWLDNGCYNCTNINCVTEKINKYTDTYQKRKEIYQWIASI